MKLKFCLLTCSSSRIFPRYLMNSVYVSALLIALLPVIVTGSILDDFLKGMKDLFSPDTKQPSKEEVVAPATLVNSFSSSAEELEHYVKLQMMLENIGEMSNLYNVPENEMNYILQKLYGDPNVQKIIQECEKFHVRPVCDNSPFRKIDGTCNNLKYPEWGSANTGQERLLPPSYNGIRCFRKSVSGTELPPARNISLKLIDKNNPSPSLSALHIFFGQTVAHDIASTPSVTTNGVSPRCCEPPVKENSSCAAIIVDKEDPFFSQYNVSCFDISRSVPYPKCSFEQRGGLNTQTSFLDVSHTYGYNDELAQSLRSNDGSGRLRSQDTTVGELLPKNHDPNKEFCPKKVKEKCFEGGDGRIYQHTMLMILQTLYLRLHNMCADCLHGMNPHWDDERVYQECRRIVIALHQYIVYKEYLPCLVGSSYMEKYDLKVNFKERSRYDDTVKPIIFSEFNAACFRLHSMVPTKISKNFPQFRFVDSNSNSDPIFRGQLASLLSGSSEVSSQKNDRFVIEDLTNYLYTPPGATYGADLAAIDIQRGRDNGLPPYVDVVKKCSDGKIIIRDFSDLSQIMTIENIALLRSVYTNVMDVDLWVGSILETSVENSVIGPTAACVLSIQFNRLKFGDRYYFLHTNGGYPFTKDQLKSIKNYCLARLLCDTAGITEVRQHPLLLPSKKNKIVSCQSIREMNLKPWKEQPEL